MGSRAVRRHNIPANVKRSALSPHPGTSARRMAMPVRRWVVRVTLRVQPLIVRAVRVQRMRINATSASRNGPAAYRFDHRVALGVHDDPADLISSPIRAGAWEPAYALCGKSTKPQRSRKQSSQLNTRLSPHSDSADEQAIASRVRQALRIALRASCIASITRSGPRNRKPCSEPCKPTVLAA